MVVSIKNYVRHRVKYRSEFIAPKTHQTQMPHTWVALRLLWNDGCRLEILEKNPIVCDLQHRWVQKSLSRHSLSHTHSRKFLVFTYFDIITLENLQKSWVDYTRKVFVLKILHLSHNFYSILLLFIIIRIRFYTFSFLYHFNIYIDQRWDAFVFRFSSFFFVSFSIIQQTTTKHNQITRKMMIIGAKDSINCIEL